MILVIWLLRFLKDSWKLFFLFQIFVIIFTHTINEFFGNQIDNDIFEIIYHFWKTFQSQEKFIIVQIDKINNYRRPAWITEKLEWQCIPISIWIVDADDCMFESRHETLNSFSEIINNFKKITVNLVAKKRLNV